MKLAVTICATKSYAYACMVQARRLQSAFHYAEVESPYIILISDKSGYLNEVADLYKRLSQKRKFSY